MYFFYIDEAGCLGALPSKTAQIQPIFTVAGIILEDRHLGRFTMDFLNLKEQFFPGMQPQSGEFLDWIKVEIKGAELRRQIREGGRDKRRHSLGVMEKLISLFEKYNVRIVGKLFVKGIGKPIDGAAVYSSSIQASALRLSPHPR